MTTASAGQSFSEPKLTKTALRSTMGESRLSALLLLSVERELTDKVDFEYISDEFAALDVCHCKCPCFACFLYQLHEI